MTESDFDDFAKAFGLAWEVCAKELSPGAVQLAFEALRSYELKQITQALSRHVRNPKAGQFPPKPADIVYQLEAMRGSDSRPGPDEAWALLAHDERSTCVWTEEMRLACASAAPLLAEGDRIAARMAFREAYEREVRRAQAEQRPVAWSISLGWDEAGREGPIREALERRRLTTEQATKYLPALEGEPTPNVRALAKDIGRKACA